MATLHIPDKGVTLTDAADIAEYLAKRGVLFTQWPCDVDFSPNATQEEILAAYADCLNPYMAANGYQAADVISVNADTPNVDALREKFLREHTHTEDEVRFFVDGRGWFWFNFQQAEPVVCVRCERGDLLSVPAGFCHWFDLGPEPFVKTIRVFTDPGGWVAHYTDSGVDAQYASPPAEARDRMESSSSSEVLKAGERT